MRERSGEVKGDKGEPVTTNRALNASGKGSKMNFFLEKRVNERDGLATRQNETRVRNEGIGTEKRANGREG